MTSVLRRRGDAPVDQWRVWSGDRTDVQLIQGPVTLTVITCFVRSVLRVSPPSVRPESGLPEPRSRQSHGGGGGGGGGRRRRRRRRRRKKRGQHLLPAPCSLTVNTHICNNSTQNHIIEPFSIILFLEALGQKYVCVFNLWVLFLCCMLYFIYPVLICILICISVYKLI